MTQVAIIDYGVGNLRSVEKAFAATGRDAVVTADVALLQTAERLVLPRAVRGILPGFSEAAQLGEMVMDSDFIEPKRILPYSGNLLLGLVARRVRVHLPPGLA